MPLSFVFRQSYKRRSLRARRTEVVLFCFWIALLLVTSGAPVHGAEWISLRLLPLSCLLAILTSNRPDRRTIAVTSLDDRAALKYGAEFDALTSVQQHDILSAYRVGTYLFPYTGDQSQREALTLSTLRAHQILRLTAVPFLLLYWAGWQLLPNGYLRACWTDSPVLLGVVLTIVVGLPHLMYLWTWQEPAVPPPLPSSATLTTS